MNMYRLLNKPYVNGGHFEIAKPNLKSLLVLWFECFKEILDLSNEALWVKRLQSYNISKLEDDPFGKI